MATSQEKRPRHYMAEIIALPTRVERREALARVPEHFRETVEREVRLHFTRKTSITKPVIKPETKPTFIKASAATRDRCMNKMRGGQP